VQIQAWRYVVVQRISDMLPPPRSSARRHWRDIAVAIACGLLFILAWVLTAVFFANRRGAIYSLMTGCFFLFTSGCCHTPPPRYIEVPVTVTKTCNLPPPLQLAKIVQATGCPDRLTCFDVENTARLADRESRMKQWIREAKAACAPAAATQPATTIPATKPVR